ncbi:squalene--hopene cyclase [Rhodopirellula sp. MGV]|nr:squalene--hopene cyclase [Rhodopirellula sp. MGV]PNY37701.1 squalene--hopene cyclase [Rhodopirellula baltica]
MEQARNQSRATLDQLREQLIHARNDQGHWTGKLSPSALSTATAISAMSAVIADPNRPDLIDIDELKSMIRKGMAYLCGQQNPDGGFGDTDRSHSNIATSYLVKSASTLAGEIGSLDATQLANLDEYLHSAGGLDGLRARYGTDKTFVVPIMNNMAIAGLISWDDVAALPFEAAVFPQSMYRFLQMPVVSYAIPALVAIGQARHFLGKRALPPIRLARSLSINRTLGVLRRMQPESGGYLEATPLTAFVVMSLAATSRSHLTVVAEGLKFLRDSMLEDGSWPIDTNLATWVTSLSIHALASDPNDDGAWYSDALADWHLSCQHTRRHPFTGAEPGGWGWTDLSGAVPDSDDTPAAILALTQIRKWASPDRYAAIDAAMDQGRNWLLRLQNRNGGWPTFCRGWGKLPFDRSSTDLTAHAIRAIRATDDALPTSATPPARLNRAVATGVRFLDRQQHADGSWHPLWFGNQDREDESNPIYGTAKVLVSGQGSVANRTAAVEYLINHQNADGGWGGGTSLTQKLEKLRESDPEVKKTAPQASAGIVSSVEETALAVEALSMTIYQQRSTGTRAENPIENNAAETFRRSKSHTQVLEQTSEAVSDAVEMAPKVGAVAAGNDRVIEAILRGVEFLTQSVRDRRHEFAWPIGFYFAKLWYHERLYPLIFATSALGKFLRATDPEVSLDWPH